MGACTAEHRNPVAWSREGECGDWSLQGPLTDDKREAEFSVHISEWTTIHGSVWIRSPGAPEGTATSARTCVPVVVPAKRPGVPDILSILTAYNAETALLAHAQRIHGRVQALGCGFHRRLELAEEV